MFSKLFNRNKKEIKPGESRWIIAEVKDGDKVFLFRSRENVEYYVESGNYSFQIGIATPITDAGNGFPSKEENEQLLVMEQILESEFTKDEVAIWVGAILGDNMKEFIFYTRNAKKAKNICEKLKKEIKHHELQYFIHEDIEWNTYKFLRGKSPQFGTK